MESYLAYTIFGLKVMDIIISIVIVSLSFLLKTIFSKAVLVMLKTFTQNTKTTIDDDMLEVLETPLKLSFTLLGFYLAKEWLNISGIEPFLNSMIKSFMIFILFMIFYKALDKSSNMVKKFSNQFGKELSYDVENFIIKTLRIIILIVGSMSILNEWGINVSAFVASLGLVGMAFALAAKDTAANLFGSLVIFSDRPFKIGDWILTPNAEGTVEEIGIRSTKVRTFAQALVNVPNAVIANTAITNWSRMGKRRIKMRLGLTYSTTEIQMKTILEELREMLKNHKDIHQDSIMVSFDEFESSALSIFCYFFTTTTVWAEYLKVRENVNLKMMEIVQKNGASFAFPSQSIYVESMLKDEMI